MVKTTDEKTNVTSTKKTRRKGLKSDTDKLNKIIDLLTNSKEGITKSELAKKLAVDKILITDGVLLEAVKIAGNAKFLENLDRQSPGKSAVKPKYNVKKGLLVQPSLFANRGIADGQLYDVQFGKKGIITLRPCKTEGETEK
jgi:hypothetical protein